MKNLKTINEFLNESTVNEAKSFEFTFNYNTGDNDKAYIEEVLLARGVNATVEYGTLEDEIIIKAKNAVELRKAKQAIQADGFEINESVVNEDVGTIALGVMLAWVGLKVIGAVAKQILGKIGMNVEVAPEKLKQITNDMVLSAAKATGSGKAVLLGTFLKIELDKKIESGEIKTVNALEKAMKEYLSTNESTVSNSLVEKAETGLYVYPSSQADFKKLEKWLDASDYYGEVDDRESFIFFPEEKKNYDELEMELDKEFTKAKISARFEGE